MHTLISFLILPVAEVVEDVRVVELEEVPHVQEWEKEGHAWKEERMKYRRSTDR